MAHRIYLLIEKVLSFGYARIFLKEAYNDKRLRFRLQVCLKSDPKLKQKMKGKYFTMCNRAHHGPIMLVHTHLAHKK